MKSLLVLILFNLSLFATQISDAQLKKMIGNMIIIGFSDTNINEKSKIIQEINKHNLGGVILFDVFYNDREKNKNILSPKQLQKLTSSLQSLSKHPILISLDQEGGKVTRLKPKYGFSEFPSAKNISQNSLENAQKIYKKMSLMLQKNGINCNFAPVVDLEVNPNNKVIVGLERSFSDDTITVENYAKILIEEQKKAGVISVLKHFPGHGSSLGDSHQGFVDITNTWSKEELEPYKILIHSKSVNMIMTAHVFNSYLDPIYPATLSYAVNTKLLREEMGYKGVIISDDLQMKAISKHYTLKETVTLSINAGVDILLFGNQLGNQDIDELLEIIFIQVKNGSIAYQKILESSERIKKLHK